MKPQIFDCQMCGSCCHGETTVSLDENDLERLVAFLNRPFQEVQEKYLRVTGKVIQMKIKDGHCIFYDQGCTVHPGKPWRCSQWPLHPSLLTDAANFSAIKASCPGINQDMEYDDFCRCLQEEFSNIENNS